MYRHACGPAVTAPVVKTLIFWHLGLEACLLCEGWTAGKYPALRHEEPRKQCVYAIHRRLDGG